MIQNILTYIIVGAAIGYTVLSILKTLKKGKSSCSCSDCSCCAKKCHHNTDMLDNKTV